MTDNQVMRILYLGRKLKLADALQVLIDERNEEIARNGGGRHPVLSFGRVSNQRLALQLVRSEPPAVILVEVEKKSESRVRFCDMVRYRLPTVSILAVAATEPQHPLCFDGLVKVPLAAKQFFATLDQVQKNCTDYLLECGPISLNLATRTVQTPNGAYAMTPKQCALLQMLMMHPNAVVKRSDIMNLIWETSYLEDTRTLDVHVRWLRERIEPDPSNPVYLTTIRGKGYQLNLV
jgi:DNA-binding response OmpR family regulator